MELEVGGVCEAFITVCALKRSLPRMGAFMLNTIKKEHRMLNLDSLPEINNVFRHY